METVSKRRPGDIARGFLLLSHPLPVLFHIIAVTLFALLATWPHLLWDRLALVVAAHTMMQLSIAVLNDYCDRRLDAVSKKSKPIPRGLVRPHEALVLGLLLIVAMFILLLPLNPLALGISLLYLAFGQGYNLGLKSTPLSGVVFALAIPLIPLYAFVGMGRIVPLMFWLIPVAALLGVALNLANSLPDIEDDAAQQARTLAVVLGVRGTLIACPLLILLGIALIALLSITHLLPAFPWVIIPTLLFACVLVGVLFLLRQASIDVSSVAAQADKSAVGRDKSAPTGREAMDRVAGQADKSAVGRDKSAPTGKAVGGDTSAPTGKRISMQARTVYFYGVVLACLVLAGGWLISVLLK
jgi:4-hydroxybenzoate polyprenyltransferase